MSIRDFTENHKVIHLMNDLKSYWDSEKPPISDVYSGSSQNRKHQYVDLVMEGGGVLGIALTGYTWAMEQVGIRFVSIGGTSAGSINALLLAGLGKPDEPRAEAVLKKIAALDMFEFVDGGDDAEDFVRDLSKTSYIGKAQRVRSVIRNLDEVFGTLGMNPGEAFLNWLSGNLQERDIFTTADLHKEMNAFPSNLKHPSGVELEAKLRVVSTDVTLGRKAVFPDEAGLYFVDADSVDPAMYVRASMAVPCFFEPLRVPIAYRSRKAMEAWKNITGYTGPLPAEVLFLDGGVLSNFPISLFHVPSQIKRAPSRPTFGIKLGVEEREPSKIKDPLSLGAAMFGAARRNADEEFLKQNPDYKHLVGYIDTGDSNWLNFTMRRDEKIRLFAAGVEAACGFLHRFTNLGWDKYKEIRKGLQALE